MKSRIYRSLIKSGGRSTRDFWSQKRVSANSSARLKLPRTIVNKLPAIIKKASLDKDTVAVLNKYHGVIKIKKAEISKKQDEEKAQAQGAPAAPPKTAATTPPAQAQGGPAARPPR